MNQWIMYEVNLYGITYASHWICVSGIAIWNGDALTRVRLPPSVKGKYRYDIDVNDGFQAKLSRPVIRIYGVFSVVSQDKRSNKLSNDLWIGHNNGNFDITSWNLHFYPNNCDHIYAPEADIKWEWIIASARYSGV